jgi:hypothetical protein
VAGAVDGKGAYPRRSLIGRSLAACRESGRCLGDPRHVALARIQFAGSLERLLRRRPIAAGVEHVDEVEQGIGVISEEVG